MEKIKKVIQRKVKLVENEQGDNIFVVDTDKVYNMKIILTTDSKNLGYFKTITTENI